MASGATHGDTFISLFCSVLLCQLRCTRVLALSIGFCTAESPLSRRFFRNTLKIAAYIGCRDEGSTNKIQNLLGSVPAQLVTDRASGLPDLRRYAKFKPETTAAKTQETALMVIGPIARGRSGS
jgi:polysaccharide pyruvyl transferase WcaK-like protein